MKKIALMGPRANRMPLAYPVYRELFEKKFAYQQQPMDADILVYSCLMDMRADGDQIQQIFSRKPHMQMVLLSEEPLWDTLWSDGFQSRQCLLRAGTERYPYYFLNHFTTRIFDFEKIPYFLTTMDDYYARYASLFARNRATDAAALRSMWEQAPIRTAFYAEYRDDPQYDADYPRQDVQGLSRFRTQVAATLTGAGNVRRGRGWQSDAMRQALPDWHLDKLAALDRCAFMVSGIENTHQWNYISEKIFDAFAALAVPLYVGSPFHSILHLIPEGAFINLYGLTVAQAVAKIRAFEPDQTFIQHYCKAQDALATIFSQPDNLLRERRRVVAEVVSEFNAI